MIEAGEALSCIELGAPMTHVASEKENFRKAITSEIHVSCEVHEKYTVLEYP